MSYMIKIGHIYPDLLNMFGDRGNIAAMEKRLTWRGIECTVTEIKSGTNFSPLDYDILLLGRGSDKAEATALKELIILKTQIKDYIENGGVFLAVCGGYPMLGNYIANGDNKTECLGIIDIYTQKTEERFIKNTILQTDFASTITGFENHDGKTFTGKYAPLGKVISEDDESFEGVVYKNLFATYLHGPLLPKNPKLTDELLSRALKQKYGEHITLTPLDDTLENEAHKYALTAHHS